MSGLTVLLVEDEKFAAKLERLILKQLGITNVLEAANGADAIAMLRQGVACDLIISDMNMPGVDGIALLEEVRRLRPALPFILLTGDPDSLRLQEAMAKGCDRYVAKPCQPEQVRDGILAALRAHGIALT